MSAPSSTEQEAGTSSLAAPPLALEYDPEKAAQQAPIGQTVKLDALGPMVDGTLARITNWEKMSERERANTLRVLGKRNAARLERLKAEQVEEEEGKAANGDAQ